MEALAKQVTTLVLVEAMDVEGRNNGFRQRSSPASKRSVSRESAHGMDTFACDEW